MATINAPLNKVRLPGTLAREVDPDHVRELAEKIRNGFILPPPLAEKVDDGCYEIVAGVHRTLAHREAGRETIELSISDKPLPPIRKLQEMWNEQEGRTGFTVFERADLIIRMMKETGKTQEEVAELLGVAPSTVAKILAVSKHLHESLRPMVLSGALPAKHAYELSKLKDDHEGQRLIAAKNLPKASAVAYEVKKRLGMRPRAAKPMRESIGEGLFLDIPPGLPREKIRERLLHFLRRLRKDPPEDGDGPVRLP